MSTRTVKRPAESESHRAWRELIERLRANLAEVRLGGGADNIAKQHAKGRMTARERIAALCDEGTEFFELGSFAAWKMYSEWGGAPSAGVITGLARVAGR